MAGVACLPHVTGRGATDRMTGHKQTRRSGGMVTRLGASVTGSPSSRTEEDLDDALDEPALYAPSRALGPSSYWPRSSPWPSLGSVSIQVSPRSVAARLGDPASRSPGSPGTLPCRGPLRTTHARSRARGPGKPLGRFRSSAASRCCPPAGAFACSGCRWRARGAFACSVRPWACHGGLGSPPRSPSW